MKVPFLQQMADLDCGPACLAMILNYHGCVLSISTVRSKCEKHGPPQTTTALIRAAREYGFDAKLLALDIPAHKDLVLPAILHWEFSHFVVLEKILRDGFEIVDPAIGRRKVSYQEFGNCFTGIAIALTKSSQFIYQKEKRFNEFHRFLLCTFKKRSFLQALLNVLICSTLIQGVGMVFPVFSLYLVDVILPTTNTHAMWVILFLGVLYALSATLLAWIRGVAIAALQRRVDAELMNGFMGKLLRLPATFFLERSAGDILSRANANTIIREALSNAVLSSTLDTILIVINIAILLYISPQFAAATCTLSAIQIIGYIIYSYALREPIVAEAKALSSYQSYLNEVLNGILIVKANGAEQQVRSKWGNRLNNYLIKSNRRADVDALHSSIVTGLRFFVPALLMWYSAWGYFDGTYTLGEFVALNAVVAMITGPLSSFVTLVRNLRLFAAHGQRLGELWNNADESGIEQGEKPTFNRDIQIDNVSFRYRTGRLNSLNNCSLTFCHGTRCAIVGPSGSGKSTLLGLLLGFHYPTTGEIRYDGRSLKALNLSHLRKNIGYVSQNNFLFNGTLRNNIALACPEANMADIEWAANVACLQEDINRMPLGFDTVVGENGINLSGGQRQRVAIARAILAKPKILIMDEATSNLDAATESYIVEALVGVISTQIWITHRLLSLQHCDQIFVIDGGRVVANGTVEELRKKSSFFMDWFKLEISNKSIS